MLPKLSNLPKKNLAIAGFVGLILILILTLGFLAFRSNYQTNLAKTESSSSASNFSLQNFSSSSLSSLSNSSSSSTNSNLTNFSSIPNSQTNSIAISQASNITTQANSSQEAICSATNPPKTTEKLQTYTNPSYPNLKINYDNSWKVEVESVSFYNTKELCEGRISLTKNSSKLTFELVPSVYISGMAGQYILKEVKVGKMVRTYYTDMDGKKLPGFENYYSYVKENSTDDGVNGNNSVVLKTNIMVNNLPDQDKKNLIQYQVKV